MPDLPAELWAQVFDLAADEDVIFQLGLPTTMAESAWFKNFFGKWALRSPQDALDLVQRRSYATKKARRAKSNIIHVNFVQAIVRTCKKWRSIGSEVLYRCLFFNDPARLLTLCAILDSSSGSTPIGWWTRRIHLTRYYANTARGTTPETLQDALISIIRHCPNLEIFIVDWPMAGSTFGPIADALATFAKKSLRTLQITIPSSALPKVIWALDSLPRIFAARIELEVATPEDEHPASDDTHLGAAGDIQLRLPALQQLVLRGHVQEFIEQATGWALPSLRHLSIDCGARRVDLPDTLAFLAAHGANLLFLDLDAIPALPLRRIIAACPALTTLAFNADWRIVVPDDEDAEDIPPLAHERLTSIGLHGLAYAFGVGYAAAHAESDPIPGLLVTSANDRTVAALCERARFPALARIRVLSSSLLAALDDANGPGVGEGMERWNRWWDACSRAGVRLEDCTGAILGTLPQDVPESESDEDSDDEEDDEEWEEEEGQSEWQITVPPLAPEGGGHLSELRQLLEECRAMDEGRDEDYMFNSPAAAALFPDIPPVASDSKA